MSLILYSFCSQKTLWYFRDSCIAYIYIYICNKFSIIFIFLIVSLAGMDD
jgi:hypothetical protein